MKGKKTGGRQPGSTNKIPTLVRATISDIINEYYTSETFTNDIAKLKPAERVAAMEKLSAYVLPKLQATTLDLTAETKKTIEDQLALLAEENEQK